LNEDGRKRITDLEKLGIEDVHVRLTPKVLKYRINHLKKIINSGTLSDELKLKAEEQLKWHIRKLES
jgi:hypothetical protein